MMPRLFNVLWTAALVVTQLAGMIQAADPAKPDLAHIERQRQASEFVGKSLQAEIDGDCLGRQHFLKEALNVTDQFAPAYWYGGHISQDDGTWLSVDETIQKAKTDKVLAEYEAMRGQQPATVQGNWQAAMWCAKKNMVLQCRAHLENILMLDHDNVTARKALGHRLVGNDWLTPDDQLRMAANAAFVKEGYGKYQKPINDLIRKAQNARGKARDSAVVELKAIEDPLAIPVMESIVGLNDKELSILAVQWLGSIDHPQAASSLARIALFADDQETRLTAVANLKTKSLFDFVPELLTAMSSPIVFSSVPVISPDGRLVGFRQAFAKENMENYQLLEADLALQTIPIRTVGYSTFAGERRTRRDSFDYDPTQEFGRRFTYQTEVLVVGYSEQLAEQVAAENALKAYAENVCRAVAEMNVVAELQSRKVKVEMENRAIAERNNRIALLISNVSNREFVTVPHDVWQWWDEYNETNYQRSKFKRYKNDQRTARIPVFYHYESEAPADIVRRESINVYKASCFVAGTKINTLRGLVEIEKIMPGDLVLSRNVYNGELCYKPVICRTNRDPAKTVILKVDEETIHSTTSHLLWVSGKGWTKAGDIKAGELLHAAADPAVVMSVTRGSVLPTHNLIVADTHTYFVGTSRVLSHDVLPRGACHEQVPGQFVHCIK